jgi:hypothetical protein
MRKLNWLREADMSAKSNLSFLTKLLETRLRSKGFVKVLDESGEEIYVEHSIYDTDTLHNALTLSLSEFNQTPMVTDYTFENTDFVRRYASILVDGAALYCLAGQALVEKGREFDYAEANIEFTNPCMSQLMMEQYRVLLPVHYNKLNNLKSRIF